MYVVNGERERKRERERQRSSWAEWMDDSIDTWFRAIPSLLIFLFP